MKFDDYKYYMDLDKQFIYFNLSDTAYGSNKDDGRWYHFDDSSVTPISENGVVVSSYFRKSLKLWGFHMD